MKTTLTRAEYCQLRLLKARADNLNRELGELVEQGRKILGVPPDCIGVITAELLRDSQDLDLDEWMEAHAIKSEVTA